MKKNTETATDAAMQSVLDAANGRATAHTLTDPSAVRRIAREAEAVLADLGLPPAHRRGARAEYVSGRACPTPTATRAWRRAWCSMCIGDGVTLKITVLNQVFGAPIGDGTPRLRTNNTRGLGTMAPICSFPPCI
jgi:hypothetical protein